MKWKKHTTGNVFAHLELKIFISKDAIKTAITQLLFVYSIKPPKLDAFYVVRHIRDACSLHGKNYFDKVAQEMSSQLDSDPWKASFESHAEELFESLFGEAYNKEKESELNA